MAKITEIVEVSTSEVHPSQVLKGEAEAEFKRVQAEKGLVVEGDIQATMTSFVVGQKARFSVTGECKPESKPSVKPTEPKEK